MYCTYKCLEEVTLEDVDNPLDGVSQLSVLCIVQFRPIFFQEQESSLRVWGTTKKVCYVGCSTWEPNMQGPTLPPFP